MKVLNSFEVEAIHGADSPPRPVDLPSMESGGPFEGLSPLIERFGSWLGGQLYDMTH